MPYLCLLRNKIGKMMKVGLFIPCYINAVYPEVGVASYKLLKSLGVDVSVRPDLLRTAYGECRVRK